MLSRTLARTAARPLAVLALSLAASLASVRAGVPGFVPAPGFSADALGLSADTFAVAPDGRLATGASTVSGAIITVYNHADPAGRRILGTYTNPALRGLGGLAFAGPDTLLVSENRMRATVFAIGLTNGVMIPLAPVGSIPNVAQVRVRPADGAVFAVASNDPGHGAVYRIAGGAARPFASNLGAGYLGGLTFSAAGNVLVADTNDPDFLGLPGRVIALNDGGQAVGALSLAGGSGSGVYDVAQDPFGALYATTGGTITRVLGGVASPLGRFTGLYPFPTDLAVDPDGAVLVNGAYTEAGGLFRIRPMRGGPRQPARWPQKPAPRPAGRR